MMHDLELRNGRSIYRIYHRDNDAMLLEIYNTEMHQTEHLELTKIDLLFLKKIIDMWLDNI